jgi:hypothetical protein
MRSSAVGPDRAAIALPLLPPEAANLYACHEVMGATACGPKRRSPRRSDTAGVGGKGDVPSTLPKRRD